MGGGERDNLILTTLKGDKYVVIYEDLFSFVKTSPETQLMSLIFGLQLRDNDLGTKMNIKVG